MAAEEYHLRCPDEAKEYLNDNRKQGLADGELDSQSLA
jgi:hypothetical protein